MEPNSAPVRREASAYTGCGGFDDAFDPRIFLFVRIGGTGSEGDVWASRHGMKRGDTSFRKGKEKMRTGVTGVSFKHVEPLTWLTDGVLLATW